jgi:hypothetical protein
MHRRQWHGASGKRIRRAGRNDKQRENEDFKDVHLTGFHLGSLLAEAIRPTTLQPQSIPDQVMEATTKVLFEKIFHLSNQFDTTIVLKNAVTYAFFASFSPDKKGSEAKIRVYKSAAVSIWVESAGFPSPFPQHAMAVQIGKPSWGSETHKSMCSRRIGALMGDVWRGPTGYQSENFSALCQINKTRYSDY